MATKLAKNGEYLEFIVIRPVGGLSIDRIATAILMWHSDTYDFDTGKTDKHNIREFFNKYNTWNKIMGRVKDVIYDEGMLRLDFAWETIENYDSQMENVKRQIQDRFNSQIGTKKS
tara:strand:+ start:255 stop:602 length:348 start_codon:yes stop_codon:yes gene_type:complete